jgi:hypothetical protein
MYIIKALRYLVAWIKLYRDYEYSPATIAFILDNYQDVICEATGNRMSKLTYYSKSVMNEINNHYEEIYQSEVNK